MLGIVIPAHNEGLCITACLNAAKVAATDVGLTGEPVAIIVVADACADDTAALAGSLGATVIKITRCNVGAARAVGAETAIAMGARWLAFTDADSLVSPDWLTQQLRCRRDAVCGTISVDFWPSHARIAQSQFLASYQDRDNHRHIHGANLGVSASAYRRAGGFQPMQAHEDVRLVEQLEAIGASIAWSCAPRVRTDARLHSKTGEGFGATLGRWNAVGQAA